MAHARLTIEQLDELATYLTQLPDQLAREAEAIVAEAAMSTEIDLLTAYPSTPVHQAGEIPLRAGVSVAVHTAALHPSAEVRSMSEVAALWEFGTQVRFTAQGWRRGAGPAHKNQGLVTIARKYRNLMKYKLIVLCASAGLRVSGTSETP